MSRTRTISLGCEVVSKSSGTIFPETNISSPTFAGFGVALKFVIVKLGFDAILLAFALILLRDIKVVITNKTVTILIILNFFLLIILSPPHITYF
ncbi:hypothetical protein SDC9_95681 [bioreactor metagenome]|uniref:Uncharacterized protein n=1 Tax=bioreactor metagenome TaxID=1076179 RepID=A0A645AH29_9ZZZZ